MLCKKTSKNQLTLPKEIANSFPETDYFEISIKDRKIVLVPVKITPADATVEGVRDKLERLGIEESDVAGAVKWTRKKRR